MGETACIPPIHGKSAKDTRAGRSAAVDMAEPGDTLEKIAADELARILKVTEVLKGIPDNAMRKARQEKMLKYFFFYRSQEGGTGTFKSLTCSQCT